VRPIVAWVTAGFVAPGVSAGFGSPGRRTCARDAPDEVAVATGPAFDDGATLDGGDAEAGDAGAGGEVRVGPAVASEGGIAVPTTAAGPEIASTSIGVGRPAEQPARMAMKARTRRADRCSRRTRATWRRFTMRDGGPRPRPSARADQPQSVPCRQDRRGVLSPTTRPGHALAATRRRVGDLPGARQLNGSGTRDRSGVRHVARDGQVGRGAVVA
jgi:hypothetical protein